MMIIRTLYPCIALALGALLSPGCENSTGNDNNTPTCGDGIVEGDEQCEPTNLEGRTCQTEGFDSGELHCTELCQLNTVLCCADACSEDERRCSGTNLEECGVGGDGCRNWEPGVDCADTGEQCNDSTGDAYCCEDACENPSEQRCNDDFIEECTVDFTGCLGWVTQLQCASGAACYTMGGPPSCSSGCTQGEGGMVGAIVTRIPTSVTYHLEQYVAADSDPAGYVYFGGSSALYRIPKAGGTTDDVAVLGGFGMGILGDTMLINGPDIIVFDNEHGLSSGLVHRISSDGGVTWNVEDFVSFTQPPTGPLRGATVHDGQILMLEYQDTASAESAIYSVDANPASLPTAATRELAISGYFVCSGLAADDLYYYTACAGSEEVIRINRATGAVTALAFFVWDLSIHFNSLHAADLSGNGIADMLYLQTSNEEGYYICNPNSPDRVFGEVASFGNDSSYGMGYDPVAHVLWFYDDDTNEVVKVE